MGILTVAIITKPFSFEGNKRGMNAEEGIKKIKEAVDTETEFICEALPCRLIGMNSPMMTQYIQFVADRVCLQLGYEKIWNVPLPFSYMETISIERKSNFFETRVSEYALANKKNDGDIFEFDADF